MADPKKDAATDIETNVKAFCKTINTDLKKWRDKIKKDDPEGFGGVNTCGINYMAEVTFKLSKGKDSNVRTPAEQALQVAKSKSWVCWGAHMSDKARHVLMTADGSVSWEPKTVFHKYFAEFKKKWGAAMKKHNLLNYAAKDGYGEGDAFHLELVAAKIDRGDKRAKSCLEEYVRLTRDGGYKENKSFEKSYKKMLEPYVKKYDKAK